MKKTILKLKNMLKKDLGYIIALVIIIVLCSIKLPYHISAPGGTINITDRIEANGYEPNGSLNLLYVTEYEGRLPLVILSYIMKNWDLESIKEIQVNNEESDKEIYERNRLMLNNSIQNATFVAYSYAGYDIKIKNKRNIVLATTIDNGLEIGDVILKINNKKIEDIKSLQETIKNYNEGEIIKVLILRDNKEKEINVEVQKDNKIGVVIVTDYDYELDPEIEIKFKKKESGSSGGLMLALTIYNAISNEDIIKGRNIAGTGTIDINGYVGEIDGIKYKVLGAIKDKIDILLVPKENYKDAIKTCNDNKCDITIVSVETFTDAITYLKNEN